MTPHPLALWVSLPVPALRIDARDIILAANPAAEEFLNLSARSLQGQRLWTRLKADTPIRAGIARARATGAPLFVDDIALGGPDRAAVPCNLQIAPLQGSDNEMILLIAPRDIATRMSRTTDTDGAARSAIGMAEMLAHEIKNPLAGITGAAQLLSMGLAGQDRDLTDLIVAESRRIVKLLDQVEQFGNLRPPVLAPVNIHDVLDRVCTSARVGFGAQMRFVADYDPSLPQALGDRDQLLQVFFNLVRNACEAGQGRAAGTGTIRLRTFYDAALRRRRPDGTTARLPLQIEVVDDGPGIRPDIADRIFAPFVSGRENGTGLGLALVARLIGDGGGWVSVDSVPGHTAFRVSLPLAPPDLPAEMPSDLARDLSGTEPRRHPPHLDPQPGQPLPGHSRES